VYPSTTALRVFSPTLLATVLVALVAVVPASRAEDQSDDGHHNGKYTVCKRGCRYEKIQRAVDTAKSGATILVGPGTYFENLVIDNKSVTLEGVSADETTVDGGYRGPVVVLGPAYPPISVTLIGLTITHGHGVTGGGIVQNAFVYLEVANSVIVSNVGTQNGGGISAQNSIEGPIIPPSILGITIESSVVAHNQAPLGAGIYIEAESSAGISDSLIAGNTGGDGAGLFAQYASSTSIVGTTISNNTASGSGGGILISGGGIGAPPAGVFLQSSAIVNNTAANTCGGVMVTPRRGVGTATCLVGSSDVVIALNAPGP
jgi:hypothetical protein